MHTTLAPNKAWSNHVFYADGNAATDSATLVEGSVWGRCWYGRAMWTEAQSTSAARAFTPIDTVPTSNVNDADKYYWSPNWQFLGALGGSDIDSPECERRSCGECRRPTRH